MVTMTSDSVFIPPLPRLMVEPFLRMALEEDLGQAGDVTTDALIPPDLPAEATMRAREAGVAAGCGVARLAFRLVDPDLSVTTLVQEGAPMAAGEALMRVAGSARSILMGERVALNMVGLMAGTAHLTREMVRAVRGTKARICATRKTTPGLRMFQKHAVLLGGGVSHRYGLHDAILIKDNHIAALGGVREALARVRVRAGHMRMVEIEVDDLAQLEEVLSEGGAQVVMLDNFSLPDVARAASMAKGRMAIEVSGGVTPENVRALAQAGADYISSGALTHSARGLDVGLDFGAGGTMG